LLCLVVKDQKPAGFLSAGKSMIRKRSLSFKSKRRKTKNSFR